MGIVTKPVKTVWTRSSTLRLCRDNLPSDGSYYATTDQVQRTQTQQYHRNQINHFLNQFKKESRNSIVLELGDLGLDVNAFIDGFEHPLD